MNDLKYCYGNSESKLIANQTMSFLPYQDTADKADPNWVDEIKYEFNSYGFRSEEFVEDTNSIVFLGCSHTMGVGLPSNKVWCHLVAESLGMRYFNLGVGAGSLDSAFRVFSEWLPIIKPKYVFLQKPQPRREIFSDGTSYRILPSNLHVESKYAIFFDEQTCYLNEKKNILALKKLFPSLIIINEENFVGNDRARDKEHFGYECHKHFAHEALKCINK